MRPHSLCHGLAVSSMRSPSQPAGLTSALSLPTRPSAEYLRNMGVDLSKAVTSHPMVLSLCIDRNVMPTVAYLRSMGMTQLGRVLTRQPSILSLSVTANLVSLAQIDRDTRQTSCRSPPPLPCRRRFSLAAARPFDQHPRWPLHTSHRPPQPAFATTQPHLSSDPPSRVPSPSPSRADP